MKSENKNTEGAESQNKAIPDIFRIKRESTFNTPNVISMISGQSFEIEVLGTLLRHIFPDVKIRTFPNAEKWRENNDDTECEAVLYNLGDLRISDPSVKSTLQEFIQKVGQRQVIVISRNDDSLAVFDAIDCGAACYIPPNAGVEELVEAIRAPASSSVVIPRSSMAVLRAALASRIETQPGLEQYFTERQLAVARALRRGDANKTIAYELNLAESTVKVHIRNIMRKLKATNRTQAAFRLNELANGNTDIEVLPDEDGPAH